MAVKKLIVCGDSYAAPSDTAPGTVFGEVLAKKLGWDVEIYARQGCSNGAIRIQIDEAIRQNPDFVIVHPTHHDRVEISAISAQINFNNHDDLETSLGLSGNYEKELGLQNINYYHKQGHAYVVNKILPRLISETLFTLGMKNCQQTYRAGLLPPEIFSAVKQYITYLYDSKWKQQLDKWIIRDGLVQLHAHNIPFLVSSGMLWTCEEMREDLTIIPAKCLPTVEQTADYVTSKLPPRRSVDPGYHGNAQSQINLADIYYDIIKNKW